MLVNIAIDQLYPHPHNPRKDLGELQELADSIKAQGILQNLSVVRGHRLSKDEWVELTRLYNKSPSEELRDRMNSKRSEDGYTIVIGHRRLAAARLAGLTEVPCAILDMDEKEQLATMMLENMQRNDLTVYEQAQGFQMMMDLGDNLSDISQKTGFSETTIRRRVKLLDLDQGKFRESIERGATLMDYAELDKINDVALKNKVLESIGTSNFQWELKNAIQKETTAANKKKLIEILEQFATQVSNTNGYFTTKWLYHYDAPDFTIPDDAKTETYYYYDSPNYPYIQLMKKSLSEPSDVDQQQDEEEKRRRDRNLQLDELCKTAYGLRKDFVSKFKGTKKTQN